MPIYGSFKERILQTNNYADIQFFPSGLSYPLNAFPGGITQLMVILLSGASTAAMNQGETIYIEHQAAGGTSVSRQEISGPGYTRGGKPILNVTGQRNADGTVVISGSSITWTGLTASPRYAVIYVSGHTFRTGDDNGTAILFTGLDGVVRDRSSDYWNYLVAHLDLGQQTVNSADFTINWSPQGILVFN